MGTVGSAKKTVTNVEDRFDIAAFSARSMAIPCPCSVCMAYTSIIRHPYGFMVPSSRKVPSDNDGHASFLRACGRSVDRPESVTS